jgi:hypothetical protein
MVALTALALSRLGYLRYTGVSRREVDPAFYKTYQGQGEPDRIAATSRHVVNLFETPVLFYVVAILAYVTEQTGALMVALAWAYVSTRVVHSWIHLTSNVVIWRFRVFIVSWLLLLAMWVTLAVGLAGSP